MCLRFRKFELSYSRALALGQNGISEIHKITFMRFCMYGTEQVSYRREGKADKRFSHQRDNNILISRKLFGISVLSNPSGVTTTQGTYLTLFHVLVKCLRKVLCINI